MIVESVFIDFMAKVHLVCLPFLRIIVKSTVKDLMAKVHFVGLLFLQIGTYLFHICTNSHKFVVKDPTRSILQPALVP